MRNNFFLKKSFRVLEVFLRLSMVMFMVVSALSLQVHIVSASGDAPVITEGDTISRTMSEDGAPLPFSLTFNATDNEGDTLTWSVSSQALNGIATASGTGVSIVVGYVPTANYNGSDSFEFKCLMVHL